MKSIDEINEGHMSPLPTPQPIVFSPQLMKLFERLVVAADRQALAEDRHLAMMEEAKAAAEKRRHSLECPLCGRDRETMIEEAKAEALKERAEYQ
jgi:hypothetical protein